MYWLLARENERQRPTSLQLRKNLIIVIARAEKEYTLQHATVESAEQLWWGMKELAAASRISNLTDCDREPIHIPGSIQPHGVLLAVDPASLKVVQIAGDTKRLLGLDT